MAENNTQQGETPAQDEQPSDAQSPPAPKEGTEGTDNNIKLKPERPYGDKPNPFNAGRREAETREDISPSVDAYIQYGGARQIMENQNAGRTMIDWIKQNQPEKLVEAARELNPQSAPEAPAPAPRQGVTDPALYEQMNETKKTIEFKDFLDENPGFKSHKSDLQKRVMSPHNAHLSVQQIVADAYEPKDYAEMIAQHMPKASANADGTGSDASTGKEPPKNYEKMDSDKANKEAMKLMDEFDKSFEV